MPFVPRLLPEGHAEFRQEAFCLGVGLRRRNNGDIQAGNALDLIEIDLRENDLLGDAERVVPVTVEGVLVDPAEVLDARERDVEQAIEELVHDRAAERNPGADLLAFANLEVRDALPSLRLDGFLARDQGQVVERTVEPRHGIMRAEAVEAPPELPVVGEDVIDTKPEEEPQTQDDADPDVDAYLEGQKTRSLFARN